MLALVIGMFLGIVISLVFTLCIVSTPFNETKDFPTKEEWKAGKHAR